MKRGLIFIIIILLGVIAYMYFAGRAGVGQPISEPIEETPSLDPAEDQKPVAIFDSLIDKEIVDENEFLIVNIVYPAFDNKKLSDEVKNVVEGKLRQFKKDINFDNFPAEERARIEQFGYKYTFDAAYKIYQGRGVSTVLLDFSAYTGGAHGSHYLKSINYNKENNRITIGDLFKPETNYLSKLSETSRINLKEQHAQNIDSWAEDGTSPTTDNFSTFYIDSEGMLNIVFQPYQVAPWASGVVEVFIDMETELKDVVSEEFLNQ